MKTILDRITENKRAEVELHKKLRPLDQLKKFPGFDRECLSLKQQLLKPGASGIIAEFKQKSPSKGDINIAALVEEVTKGYVNSGACGLSVLTDHHWFGGSLNNLEKARNANRTTPLLRKDFIVDPYQIYESKAFGADVVLLIAACLSTTQAGELSALAKELGMELLFEIHDEQELERIPDLADFTGINNRNLKTMEVSLETSLRLVTLITRECLKISESGLASPASVKLLKTAGYHGFLLGENFMKYDDPAKACKEFIIQL